MLLGLICLSKADWDIILHIFQIWDPFTGDVVQQLESTKYSPVIALATLPSPSTVVVTATTDSTLRYSEKSVYHSFFVLFPVAPADGCRFYILINSISVWLEDDLEGLYAIEHHLFHLQQNLWPSDPNSGALTIATWMPPIASCIWYGWTVETQWTSGYIGH